MIYIGSLILLVSSLFYTTLENDQQISNLECHTGSFCSIFINPFQVFQKFSKRFEVFFTRINGSELPSWISIEDRSDLKVVSYLDTSSAFGGIAIKGNYAYVVSGPSQRGLRVIDVSDPENPFVVGSYVTSSNAGGVGVKGNYAYVLSFDVHVIDVSNPSSPVKVGEYNTHSAREIVFSGDVAYVADYDRGLKIIDVSSPNPTHLGSAGTQEAFGIDVSGDFVYVADGYGGLKIFDVSDPTNPSLIGSFPPSRRFLGVFVKGDFAYVRDQFEGLKIFDVSNPFNPILVGEYGSNTDTDIVVVDNFCYISNGRNGLRKIDISDPSNPKLAGILSNNMYSHAVACDGNFAYIATGLTIVNITREDRPTKILLYGIPTDTGMLEIKVTARSLDSPFEEISTEFYIDILNKGPEVVNRIEDHTISLRRGDRFSLVINVEDVFRDLDNDKLNVKITQSDGSNLPPWLNVKDNIFYQNYMGINNMTLVYTLNLCNVRKIKKFGSYAYVVCRYQSLWIFNISNLELPLQVGYLKYGNGESWSVNLDIIGNFLYLVDNSGIKIINVSNPANPMLHIEYLSSQFYDFAITVHQEKIFTYLPNNEGLYIYVFDQVSNPILTNITVVDILCYNIFIVGKYLYCERYSLTVYDITIPLDPTYLSSSFYQTDFFVGLEIDRDFSYYMTQFSVEILDVSDLANPYPLEGLMWSGGYDFFGIDKVGDFLYIASNQGIVVVNVSNPSTSFVCKDFKAVGEIREIQIFGNYAYVGSTEGIKIVKGVGLGVVLFGNSIDIISDNEKLNLKITASDGFKEVSTEFFLEIIINNDDTVSDTTDDSSDDTTDDSSDDTTDDSSDDTTDDSSDDTIDEFICKNYNFCPETSLAYCCLDDFNVEHAVYCDDYHILHFVDHCADDQMCYMGECIDIICENGAFCPDISRTLCCLDDLGITHSAFCDNSNALRFFESDCSYNQVCYNGECFDIVCENGAFCPDTSLAYCCFDDFNVEYAVFCDYTHVLNFVESCNDEQVCYMGECNDILCENGVFCPDTFLKYCCLDDLNVWHTVFCDNDNVLNFVEDCEYGCDHNYVECVGKCDIGQVCPDKDGENVCCDGNSVVCVNKFINSINFCKDDCVDRKCDKVIDPCKKGTQCPDLAGDQFCCDNKNLATCTDSEIKSIDECANFCTLGICSNECDVGLFCYNQGEFCCGKDIWNCDPQNGVIAEFVEECKYFCKVIDGKSTCTKNTPSEEISIAGILYVVGVVGGAFGLLIASVVILLTLLCCSFITKRKKESAEKVGIELEVTDDDNTLVDDKDKVDLKNTH